MRHNPTHQNTCANRIKMYREGQCTDGPRPCAFLSECERHYDEKTGDWDYPNPLIRKTQKSPARKGRYGCGDNHHAGASSPSRLADRKRRYRIAKGLEAPMEITTTLDQALAGAGL